MAYIMVINKSVSKPNFKDIFIKGITNRIRLKISKQNIFFFIIWAYFHKIYIKTLTLQIQGQIISWCVRTWIIVIEKYIKLNLKKRIFLYATFNNHISSKSWVEEAVQFGSVHFKALRCGFHKRNWEMREGDREKVRAIVCDCVWMKECLCVSACKCVCV